MLRFILAPAAAAILLLAGCTKQPALTPLGQQVLDALSQHDAALAYELSEKAIAAGELDSRVVYIAAAGNFFDGNLERCINLSRRINPEDSLYSRACVLRSSALLQQDPESAPTRDILKMLLEARSAETRAEYRSVLAEAEQLVYRLQRQRICSTNQLDPGSAAFGGPSADSCLTCTADLLLAAYRGVQDDPISFPSWTVLSQFQMIAPSDSLTRILYETASACMTDDRITSMHATGMVVIAMTTAAERGEVDRLAAFARMYLAINGEEGNEVFLAFTLLPATASRSTCLLGIEDAYRHSEYLRRVMSYGQYPRILIPGVTAPEVQTGTATTGS